MWLWRKNWHSLEDRITPSRMLYARLSTFISNYIYVYLLQNHNEEISIRNKRHRSFFFRQVIKKPIISALRELEKIKFSKFSHWVIILSRIFKNTRERCSNFVTDYKFIETFKPSPKILFFVLFAFQTETTLIDANNSCCNFLFPFLKILSYNGFPKRRRQ